MAKNKNTDFEDLAVEDNRMFSVSEAEGMKKDASIVPAPVETKCMPIKPNYNQTMLGSVKKSKPWKK